MKRSELKSIIKECIKEILFEEGVLSNLVAEVAFGITKAQDTLTEQGPTVAHKPNNIPKQERKNKLLETKKKMAAAIGGGKMKGVFEGTEPLPKSEPHSPLSGLAPGDAGVDISGLFSLAGQKWKNLK